MARTEDEIRQSLIETLRGIDPSTDVVKGPINLYLLRPVPTELQKTEADVDRLANMTSHRFGQVANQTEVAAVATSFSIRLGGGRSSKTRAQQFFTSTRPTSQDLEVPRGVLVSTEDQQYAFFVTEPVTLPVASADNFFNPATRRYEVLAQCEATSVGPDFDLPARRVTRILTPVAGFDGTTNLTEYTGGAEEEDQESSVERIQAKLAGLDPETGGGVKSDIRNFDPENITDVQTVFPKDRAVFRRLTRRPAIDAYVVGHGYESIEQEYTGVGGELQIPLERRPVDSITSVTVNGTNVTFSFIKDESLETGGSPRSTDYCLLDAPLIANDLARITYVYDDLFYQMENRLFNFSRPFETDVLVRVPRAVPIEIVVDATVLPSGDEARVSADIESFLVGAVETGRFQTILLPEVLRQQLQDSVSGIGSVRFERFRQVGFSFLDVETVTLAKGSLPEIDQELFIVKVRK